MMNRRSFLTKAGVLAVTMMAATPFARMATPLKEFHLGGEHHNETIHVPPGYTLVIDPGAYITGCVIMIDEVHILGNSRGNPPTTVTSNIFTVHEERQLSQDRPLIQLHHDRR